MSSSRFDPEQIFQVLADNDVDYVVIGAMAAMLQGAGLATTLDVDVTAATDEHNRERLALALKAMDARLRVPDPEDAVEVPLDAGMLASAVVMTFVTRFGPFDVLFAPAGAPPYEELRERASVVTRFGVAIRVADVEDIVQMKRAAGREKDAAHLTTLIDFLKGRSGSGREGKKGDV
ncbi:MAG TPA: hypothetical protein VFF07_12125 [Actinomycetota bacterium]|nr:hypothetical protein [Actinomycetota bacterium]